MLPSPRKEPDSGAICKKTPCGQQTATGCASQYCCGKVCKGASVDLSVRRWYQKQAGLVGILPNSKARALLLRFKLRESMQSAEPAED
jgi:hypothetical protein